MRIIQGIIELLSRGLGRRLTEQEIETAKIQGNVLDAEDRARATFQSKCNHKKGGIWTRKDGKLTFRSACSNQYSVMKHQHMNGDIWVRCLRCGRQWKPPIRADFRDERFFYRALEEYETAVNFETNNTMSTSVQCSFILNGSRDAGHEYVRKQLANS